MVIDVIAEWNIFGCFTISRVTVKHLQDKP